MSNNHTNHLLLLLLATLFISTSGALGKFIDMPTPVIIWWRSILAMGLLYGFSRYKKISLKIKSKKNAIQVITSALFMAAHWVTYFYALKLSNVAIGMLSLFTFPIITALLEPLFTKIKFDPIYILLSVMVLFGMYILVPEFNMENTHAKGILFGLFSAFCYALRNILSKKLVVVHYNPTSIMFYQLFIITIILTPVLFFMDTSGIKTQYPYIILLATLTTAIGHTMLVNSLKHFTASTASIIGSVQPILGIIIAFLFLKEIPTWNTFFGGLIILSTVVIESIRSKKA
ncbi:DMT family transporter [Flavivirga jejuensis]|uniref:EamA family transporter n=1 Tax=Flavivirga jejuensis TaxID=870487 RepID=A0ABT8WJI9_9FLAO|nr:EamA family transporter [Flavivirga jejuensis]MDO5973122.1 EamA family transporter [Flavivirga jejuensis]